MRQLSYERGWPTPSGDSGKSLASEEPTVHVPLDPPTVAAPEPPPVVCAASPPIAPPRNNHSPKREAATRRFTILLTALHGQFARKWRLGHRAISVFATRRVTATALSLATLLLIGSYTGYQVVHSRGAETGTVKSVSQLAAVTVGKTQQARRLGFSLSTAQSDQASVERPAEAQALFTAIRDGLSKPAATELSTRPASAYRRGNTAQPLPEPPLAEPQLLLAANAPLLPTSVVEATCELSDCELGTCSLCETSSPEANWDNKLGTTIEWHSNYYEARRLAQEQGKLLFVMCISGDFSDPGFT